jgi:hypothetical protein
MPHIAAYIHPQMVQHVRFPAYLQNCQPRGAVTPRVAPLSTNQLEQTATYVLALDVARGMRVIEMLMMHRGCRMAHDVFQEMRVMFTQYRTARMQDCWGPVVDGNNFMIGCVAGFKTDAFIMHGEPLWMQIDPPPGAAGVGGGGGGGGGPGDAPGNDHETDDLWPSSSGDDDGAGGGSNDQVDSNAGSGGGGNGAASKDAGDGSDGGQEKRRRVSPPTLPPPTGTVTSTAAVVYK